MQNYELLLIFSPILLTIALFFVIFKLNSKIKDLSDIKKYSFNVQEPYRIFLLDSSKIIEGRLNKGKFKECKIGDIFYFDDGENEEFEVWTKREYKTFKEMLENEGLQNVLPDKDNMEKALEEVYYRFYSKEDEEKYGVVAIEVRKN